MRRFATEQWPDTIGRKVSTGLPLKVSLGVEFIVTALFNSRVVCMSVVHWREYMGSSSQELN